MSGLLMPPDSLLLSPRSNSIFDSEFGSNFLPDFSQDMASAKDHHYTPLMELKNPESMPVSELDRLLSTSGGGSFFPSLSRKVSVPSWSNINAKHLGHTPHRQSNLRNAANGILQNAANSSLNASTSPYLGLNSGAFASISPSPSIANGTKNTTAPAPQGLFTKFLNGSVSSDKQLKNQSVTLPTLDTPSLTGTPEQPMTTATLSGGTGKASETPASAEKESKMDAEMQGAQHEEQDDETESELEDDETLTKSSVNPSKPLVKVSEYADLKVYETIMPGTDLKLMRIAGADTVSESNTNGRTAPVHKKVISALNNEQHAGFMNAAMLRLAARTTIGDGQFDINQEHTVLYIVLEGPMEVRGAW